MNKMRILVFTRRNLKEILREPLSLIFNFAFPIVMLLLFYCFIMGKDKETIERTMPMFLPNRIVPSIVIFGFSFLSLFTGMLVAKDQSTAFAIRLKASPLEPYELFMGYFIPMVFIAYIQMLIVYIVGFIFSLMTEVVFDLFSFQILLTFVANLPIMIFFISIGILIGLLVNEKAVGGIASLIVNLVAITSGMFMPIDQMGCFKCFSTILPFLHAVSLSQNIVSNFYPSCIADFEPMKRMYENMGIEVNYTIFDTWWMHFVFVILFACMVVGVTILVFKNKMSKGR